MMERKAANGTQTAGNYEILVKIIFCRKKESTNSEGNRGKKVIYRFLIWLLTFLLTNFFGGYVGHVAEPVYEMIDDLLVSSDQSVATTMVPIVSDNMEIILHDRYITKDFVEVSFKNVNCI